MTEKEMRTKSHSIRTGSYAYELLVPCAIARATRFLSRQSAAALAATFLKREVHIPRRVFTL